MALPIPQTLNGISAASVRFCIPWRGVWLADIDLAAEDVLLVTAMLAAETPSILIAGGLPFKCVIDPSASGVFGDRAHCRVVGAIGWMKDAPAQHFPGPPVTSLTVYAATAASVLEPPPLDPIPVIYGENFARVAGPAFHVFGDRDWRVDMTTGIATTAPWLPAVLDPTSSTISDFDIGLKKVTIKGENVITPGTVLVDPRFGATTYIVRDVEQTFNNSGGLAECYVAEKPTSRLADTMKALVNALARPEYLKTYKYRFVLPIGGKLALQGVTDGAPDLNPIDQWTGLSGISASLLGNAALAPATEIIVGFAGGDPKDPYLCAFSSLAKPLAITLDAVGPVNVGIPTSPAALAVGVVAALNILQVEVAAIAAALAAQAGAGAWLPPTALSTMAPAIAAAVTAASIGLAAATATIPSTKLNSQ